VKKQAIRACDQLNSQHARAHGRVDLSGLPILDGAKIKKEFPMQKQTSQFADSMPGRGLHLSHFMSQKV
jgi:hypothetical protein